MNELAFAAYLTLFASDSISTRQAFAFCETRACTTHELLLTQNATVNDAILAGQAAALWWATGKIKQPVVRWGVRLGVAGIHGLAAGRNWNQIQKARTR